jgi:signal transduction histidine kinase
MSAIVEDLLVAARADTGNVSVVLGQADVGVIVRDVLRGLPASDQQIDNLVANGVVALCDEVRCGQVVRNLVVNSIRHGGETTWIESEVTADSVLIHVCDDGPGVPSEMEETIFEPYVSRPNDARRPESVGLGLTVCRELSRLMGGDVLYRRTDHTRFTLRLRRPAPFV